MVDPTLRRLADTDMNIESFFLHACGLPFATHDTPFGPDVVAFRVGGKIFALMGLERLPLQANLKAPPEMVPELQARYEGVLPGYHVSKKHWVSVVLDSDVPGSVLRELIEQSYNLILESLPASKRNDLSGPQ